MKQELTPIGGKRKRFPTRSRIVDVLPLAVALVAVVLLVVFWPSSFA